MKKAFIATLLALASLSSAAASLEGNIRALHDQAGARIGSTVDHWTFTARSTGLVAIDVLSWEAPAGIATDLNGDGEIAFFDSVIYLFRDDGVLDASDFVAPTTTAAPPLTTAPSRNSTPACLSASRRATTCWRSAPIC